MRIGTSAAETGGDQALVKLTDQLRRAADDGFASVWMSNIFGLEALTSLAVAGSRVPGIELGTAVVPTYPRHPAVLAQQALTAALAVGPGRLALGGRPSAAQPRAAAAAPGLAQAMPMTHLSI